MITNNRHASEARYFEPDPAQREVAIRLYAAASDLPLICPHGHVDPRIFADNFHLFRGTPSGTWLRDELFSVFGVSEKLTSANAQEIYDQIDHKLRSPELSPRTLYERFNIEVLCTTDAATDTLEHHQAIRRSGWKGRILPTFRPDSVVSRQLERYAALLRSVHGNGRAAQHRWL